MKTSVKSNYVLLAAWLALVLSANLMADPVQHLAELEGSVKDGRFHVVYDDATGIGWKDGLSSDFIAACKGRPTIGYGETAKERVELGVVSEETARRWLSERTSALEDAIRKLVKVELTRNQMDALVCFSYNVGIGAFRESTLLKVLNQGHYDEVPAQMRRWVYTRVSGKAVVSDGLKNRREKEVRLWLGK